jgi:hypothetical protein
LIIKKVDNMSEDDSTVIEIEPSEKPAPERLWVAFGEEDGFELDITAMTEIQAKQAKTLDDTDAWSLFTPIPPSPTEDGEGQEMKPTEVATKMTDRVELTEEEAVSSSSSTASATSEQESLSDEDAIRIVWKIVHRVLGVILLSMAWYNCHTGIVLFSEKYNTNNERGLLNLLWGFAGLFGVIFLIANYILRAQ